MTEAVSAETGKKPAAQSNAAKKIKVTLQEDTDGPLALLVNSLKERGVRNPDLGQVIQSALNSMADEFWQEQLEALTPLEVRVQEAMEDPQMRAKLVELLNKAD